MWTLHMKELRASIWRTFIQVTITTSNFVHVLSLLEILECVEILLSPKVQCSDISVHLESGRLVHLGKTVCPRHGIYISRSHEAGGRGWNRPCPIDEVARCRDLESCSCDICNRIGAILPLYDTAVLGGYQHANPGARCINGCSGH